MALILGLLSFATAACPQESPFHMEPNNAAQVHYDRWNEDNININVEATQTTKQRLYNRLCVGTTGIVVKAVGALAAAVVVYILGYVTGYYVHNC